MVLFCSGSPARTGPGVLELAVVYNVTGKVALTCRQVYLAQVGHAGAGGRVMGAPGRT